MRVAVITWSARRVGGIEEYLSILLPALQKAGMPVVLWHELDEPRDRQRIEIPDGVVDICAKDMGLEPAIQALRQWRPDVLYSHGLIERDVEARLLQIAPAVFFVHSYTGTCISGGKTFTRPVVTPCSRRFGWPCLVHYFPHGCGGRSPITMWRHYKRQSHQLDLLRHYHAILTHTDHMRNEMTRHGLNAEVLLYPVKTNPPGERKPGDGTWRLLYVGRMEFLKGGLFLIDALREIAGSAKQGVRLILAGDGPQRPSWEARARAVERAVPNVKVEFTGWLAQDQVGTLVSNADLLVVPSLWPEPFGSVGPMAAKTGVPAAGFAVGGIPQWLVDGVSGHLAPADPPTVSGLARAIVRCLENPLHYEMLKQGARDVSAKFTMARHLPELTAVFERVCAEGARADPVETVEHR
jgi:glycosyltransferase involved in cell wall biosynthesis